MFPPRREKWRNKGPCRFFCRILREQPAISFQLFYLQIRPAFERQNRLITRAQVICTKTHMSSRKLISRLKIRLNVDLNPQHSIDYNLCNDNQHAMKDLLSTWWGKKIIQANESLLPCLQQWLSFKHNELLMKQWLNLKQKEALMMDWMSNAAGKGINFRLILNS